jgi:c-di-GMP phosphodiesterase
VEKYQIDPSGFCIEINETFCQGNQAEATKMLQFLHGVGFQLAIEGLGAGYSSLLQLVEFPVRYIKLDRNLVANSIQSGRHRILKSLIEFCHVQDLEVVAEGVEEVEQAQWLAANGCDYLQGYLYSRPVSLKQLLAAEFSWRPAG